MSEEIEEKARGMGWVPQEDFKGDPEKWRPAEEFVERGENYVGIVKDRLAKTEKMIEQLVKTQKAEIARVRKETYEEANQKFTEKFSELQKREWEAFKENDEQEFTRVKQEMANLKPPKQDDFKEPDEPKGPTPVFQDWNKKNSWYAPDPTNPGDADIDLSAYANGIASLIQAEEPGIPEADFLKKVEERVKRKFPDKFSNPKRDTEVVDGGSPAPVKGGKKTWSDLPKEAKDAYPRLAARVKSAGGDLKKEDYITQYFED